MIDQMEGETTVASANRKSSAVTGSTRKIKDNAADWHNLIIRWDKINSEGFSAATKIVNLRQERNQQLAASVYLQTGGAAAPCHSPELQDECHRLQDVVDRMVGVVRKMERLMTSQRGVHELEEFQFHTERRKFPLFHSWTTRQFEETSCYLLDTYREELRLKQTILQELAHTATSDLCMVYLSCWLQQPFIPQQARLRLEALLLETGHRPA
ncbi:cyclin-dependent kinase 2-interacting protein [Genypterus blacodes]|uniref:cyclin-dependent kinase 2-interacting protein n=1 Tax=Genypterus blacodes TaxID=154954 RepID=UPI003F769CE2